MDTLSIVGSVEVYIIIDGWIEFLDGLKANRTVTLLRCGELDEEFKAIVTSTVGIGH
jgi:hypothetical protein